MFNFFEKNVLDLKRISIGKLELKDIEEGTYRSLTEKEISYLKKICNLQ